MLQTSMCLTAEAENKQYRACWTLAHPVEPEKTEAKIKTGY